MISGDSSSVKPVKTHFSGAVIKKEKVNEQNVNQYKSHFAWELARSYHLSFIAAVSVIKTCLSTLFPFSRSVRVNYSTKCHRFYPYDHYLNQRGTKLFPFEKCNYFASYSVSVFRSTSSAT